MGVPVEEDIAVVLPFYNEEGVELRHSLQSLVVQERVMKHITRDGCDGTKRGSSCSQVKEVEDEVSGGRRGRSRVVADRVHCP